jgi:hypothetical protein
VQQWAEPGGSPIDAPPRATGPRVGVLRPDAPADARHGLRPLATFEIVDQATSFWRRRVGAVVAVTLAATLPVQAASALACRTRDACAGVNPSLWGATTAIDAGSGDVLAVVVLAFVAAFAGQFAATAVAHLVTAERLGNELAAGAALRLAVRQAPRVSAAWVLGHLLVALSVVTVVGPVVTSALFLVVTPAIAVERIGPIAGLRRSWRLGRTRFWPVLGVHLASGLVASLLGLAFSALPLAFTLYGPLERWSWLFEAAAGQLQLLVAVPLTAAAATLAYLDLRVRAEGLDLRIDADRAFAPPEAATAGPGEVRPALAR